MNAEELLKKFGDENVVFDAPWQAHAFAMTVKLHETGQFTWNEWADALSAEIKQSVTNAASAASSASAAIKDESQNDYYEAWLGALEKLVIQKRLGSSSDLDTLRQKWASAAAHTPHGKPIQIDTNHQGRQT